MKLSEKVDAILKSIQLTDDDSKSFERRGSFAQHVKDALNKLFVLVDTDTKTIKGRNGDLEFTVLKFAQEDMPNVTAKLTIAFDFQNIFLSSDKKMSLKQIGEAEGGLKAIEHMGMFVVDSVEPQGVYPMKYSRAAQDLGYPIGKTYTDENYATLRTKYRDDAFKVARTDATDDISWLEVNHIYITPKQ